MSKQSIAQQNNLIVENLQYNFEEFNSQSKKYLPAKNVKSSNSSQESKYNNKD